MYILKKYKYILKPFGLFLIFLLMAIVSEKYILSDSISKIKTQNFQNSFYNKEKLSQDILNDLSVKLINHDSMSDYSFYENLKYLNNLFDREEISILITKNKELVYWSDNVIGFAGNENFENNKLIKLINSYNYYSNTNVGDLTIHALILIRYNYKIQNNFLNNSFAYSFNFPEDYEISESDNIGFFPVKNLSGEKVFFLNHIGEKPCIYNLIYIPIGLFLISFIFLFVLFYRINSHYIRRNNAVKSLILFIFLACIYLVMNVFNVPSSLYYLDIFSPKYFAYTSLWTSLGEFLVFAALILFWSINFYRSFDISENAKKNSLQRRVGLGISLFVTALLLILIRYLLHILIMNSSISFALYRVEDLSIYTLIGYLTIGLLCLSLIFICYKIVRLYRKHTRSEEFLTLISSIFLFLFFLTLFDKSFSFRLSLFFIPMYLVLFYSSRVKILSHRLSGTVLLVFMFTLFTLFNGIDFIKAHENKIQETMVMNLSSEHDPNAEIFIKEIDLEISSDTVLIKQLNRPFEELENYIVKNYFSSYFREYNIQITICGEGDNLIIQPENITRPCLSFFNEMLEKDGTQLGETNFFFLENTTGRISYAGRYELQPDSLTPSVNLFIELNSKLLSEGTGFPELLLPQNTLGSRLRTSFSFAKYNNGQLVDRGGDFLYALSSDTYDFSKIPLSLKSFDGFEHVIYFKSPDNCILVSREKETVFDYLISFPYIFVFFFFIALPVNAFSSSTRLINKGKSLRTRIQYSIIGIVIISLLVIGGGTIYYIISQYRSNHREDLVDRINSVSMELEVVINNDLINNYESNDLLNYELIRISEVFKTDINIFDTKGYLIATSRPEIFEKGLILPVMNKIAFQNLGMFKFPLFLHEEHISKMNFMSAYLPLNDNKGNISAYLNLPYFMQEKEFRQEITTFILAFFNIYVFLLLASVIVAWFVSSKITDPLKLIRENLRGVQLGKNPRPIHYKEDDEIGILVSEYNHKVEELAASADLLARSERESAWREMAKQIAHEIKNPLTPMKLNIQFLQRSNPKSMEDYDEIVKKVTGTIIEQIENLSTIATEFSNFAKMPKVHNEKFNLSERLLEIIGLYNYTGESEFITDFKLCESIQVLADKEQFSRAMINLIRNALQSIPDTRKGEIKISIEEETNFAVVKVSDNGKGIPDNLKESIFMPNFTTKSSGAGLGLAITKNIVEGFKGDIWFTSETDKGSTFFIRIPVVKE